MGFSLRSNPVALNTQRQLTTNQNSLHKSLERLSSGRKLNHAADGPASLVISEQMNLFEDYYSL